MSTNRSYFKRRVVITGLGVVTPLGCTVERYWTALCNGESGIRRITYFDPSQFDCQIAGQVKEFYPENYIERKELRHMDRFVQYAVVASIHAAHDAGLELPLQNPARVGVLIGSGIGGIAVIEAQHKILLEKGPGRVSPFFIPMQIANMAAGQVSIYLGASGPVSCITTACASGVHAIGDSFKIIQRGDAELMIAGGTESAISPTSVAGFCAARALTTRNEIPTQASCPFDRKRDGFVMGEGAGIIVLEEMEHALSRGARIYGEVVGYGMTGDAYHVTAPDPNGDGAARCMQMALDDGGLMPTDVNYINAHGTSTPLNDKVETLAIKKVFNEHAYKLAISSTKSMIGHLLGAAGGVEMVATILTIYRGVIHPTINYQDPDPECDLDYVPNHARRLEVQVALCNSLGFGGHNATLAVKKFIP